MDSGTQSFLAFLQLSRIREALGEAAWLQKKRQIRKLAAKEVESLLTAQDAYCFHGDELCMIAFANTTADSVELMTRAIGDKIVRSLFGDEGVKNISLVIRILPTNNLLDSKAFDFPVNDSDEPDEPDDPAGHTDPASPPPLFGEGGGPSKQEMARKTRRKLLLSLFQESDDTTTFFEFRPIWDIKDQIVRTFRCVPCYESLHEGKVSGHRIADVVSNDMSLTDIDIDALETGLIELKHALDNQNYVNVVFGVHFETLAANKSRSELAKILRLVPNPIRERIGFIILGIPDGVPLIRLQEIDAFLKSFCGVVSVALDTRLFHGHKLMSLLATARAAGINSIFSIVPDGRTQAIDAFCRELSRLQSFGLLSHVMGITSGDQVLELAHVGTIFFDGRFFGGPFLSLPKPYYVAARDLENYHAADESGRELTDLLSVNKALAAASG